MNANLRITGIPIDVSACTWYKYFSFNNDSASTLEYLGGATSRTMQRLLDWRQSPPDTGLANEGTDTGWLRSAHATSSLTLAHSGSLWLTDYVPSVVDYCWGGSVPSGIFFAADR